MAQKLIRKTKGLYLNTNELSESPEGSLLLANNIVIDRDSIIESRRGFDKLTYKFRDSSDRAHNLFNYQNKILAHNSTDLMSWYDPDKTDTTSDIASASNVITNISPNTDNLSVGMTIIGSYRFEVTCVADVSGSLASKYFLLNSANNTTRYYVWYQVSGTGTDPNLVNRTGIQVNITTNDSASNVALATQLAIDALGDFIATVSLATVTVTNAATGPADIARNAFSPNGPGFSFVNTGTGIPDGTVIDSIDSATQVTVSQNITDTRTTGNISFAGWRNYNGTYTVPNANLGRIRSAEGNQNFYFVTNLGIQKLDVYNGDIRAAGGIKAIDGEAALSGASGFMPDDSQVAYRIVWGYKDFNNNLILGTPSERIIVINSSGGTRDVQITFFIPDGITVDHFYQIYRSAPSATANDIPGDELNLVYEDNPTSGEITAKEVSIVDNTPEALRNGPSLYTNASQEGILEANEVPPFAEDIANFKDCMFYANTRTRQRLNLTMLAVSGDNGVHYSQQAATYVNATQFTVPSSTGLAAGQSITGPGANIPTGLTIQSITGAGPYTVTVAGGTLTLWGATITVQFRDLITIAGVQYIANDLTRSFNANVTISGPAVPAVVTWNSHGLSNGSTVFFTTTGTLPSPLVANTTYYVVNAAANTFELSLTQGGASINTTTPGSGIHSATANDRKFQVYTAGSPSQNIDDTSRALIKVINSTTNNTSVYAYYLSGPEDLPGFLLIEGRTLSVSAFSATANSHGSAWNPVLPSSGTSILSSNDRFLNGLYFSKSLQPDAVPLNNYLRIGSADKAILRIVPLRDTLFVFKEDGIFRVLGTSPLDFRADLLDNTATLIAPETAVPLNNQIFCFADQGIVAVSDTGVEIISRQIENDFLRLLSLDLTDVAKLSFGISYESDRKYILSIISSLNDTTPTQMYVYNTFTKAWTKWTLSKQCGIINRANDRLLFGDASSNAINVERKARDYTDYIDDEFTKLLISQTDKVLTLQNVIGISVGDLVFQGNTYSTKINEVNSLTNEITVDDDIEFVPNELVTIQQAIETVVEYIPEDCDNPGVSKQIREISMFFKEGFFDELELSFVSDLSGNRDEVTLNGFLIGLWGLFPWGSLPWGGTTRQISLRTYIPSDKQRCSQLTIRLRHREGFSFYALNGLSLIYNSMSERLKR